jgi:esterase/lipase
MNKPMLTLLLSYLFVVLTLFVAQRKLIYLPDQYSPSAHQQLVAEAKLQYWPSVSDYRALIRPQANTQYRGTVLVLHGNAGSAVSRVHYFNALESIGYRVIIAEYPGYGSRPGSQSEQRMIEDTIKTADLVYRQFGEPLFLSGESLGSGVLSGVIAKQVVPVTGLVLITPFDSLANVAQSHYWWVMAKWLTLDQFNNVENLKQYPGNIAVIMAERDQIIPNKHTLKLFEQIKTTKRLWRLPNSDHNNWPQTADQAWWPEVMAFLTQTPNRR